MGEKEEKPLSDLSKLRSDIERSCKFFKSFRENRLQAIESYVGSFYAAGASKEFSSIGLLNLAVDVFSFKLVASNPRALVSTRKRQFRSEAATLALAVDRDIERMDLGNVLRRCTKEALFSLGIAQVSLVETGMLEIEDVQYRVGDSMVLGIDLDDFVADSDARTWNDCYFLGHRIRVPLEWARNYDEFDETARRRLQKTENYRQNPSEAGGGERAEGLSKQDMSSDNTLVPQTDIWVIFLPPTREIVMLSVDSGGGELLRKPWTGPPNPTGPYRMLGFETVSSNLMPLAPVANWRALSDLANDLLLKIGEQAKDQKTVYAASRKAAKDAENIRSAADMDVITVDYNPREQIAEFKTGGADPASIGLFLQVKDLFSWVAGNLDVLAGLGPQSETVGQDRLLAVAANMRVKAMSSTITEFARAIMSDIAWYRWHDPLSEVNVTKRIPGTEIEIPAVFSADSRQGRFEDYEFKIHPYSMQQLSPEERLQRLRQVWLEDLLPAAQLSGGTVRPKVPEYVRKVGKYSGIEEDVDDIVETVAPPETPEGQDPAQQAPMKPAVTQRNYTRTNRPGATRRGNDQILGQVMLGGRPQKSELAALGRPTGL